MSYHVLIVDDDPAICKLLSKVMISNEMDPLVVNSGAAALDVIARQSGTLDMILMDITLGDMEGFDVIQTIRRNGVTTPVIIISGRNEDYDFMYGLSLGADDYVTKPFRPQILGAKVKALIRRSKSFSQENSQQISCGPFLCDTTTMRFYKNNVELNLSLIHISEPTRRTPISYAVFCLKKKKWMTECVLAMCCMDKGQEICST